MEFEDIKTIAILVQLENGNAHQVLSTVENKQIVLRMLATLDGSLKLSSEIEPVQFIEKKG